LCFSSVNSSHVAKNVLCNGGAVLTCILPIGSQHSAMDRYQGLAEEIAALVKGEHRAHLTLPDLLQLQQRGNVALPIDLTHLGCLWVLDR
jgi:hypothetical protein